MKKILLLFCSTCLVFSLIGQGTETFTTITGTSTSYLSRSWTGDDGSTWTATNARIDQQINSSEAITLNDDVADTYVQSGTIAGGLGDITITTLRVFAGGSGSLNVLVNGNNVGTVPYSDVVQTTTISGVNVIGNVVIRINNDIGGANGGGDNRVAIDNVTWTGFSSSDPSVQFTAANYSVNEEDGIINATVCVSIANENANPTSVDVALTGGTATNGTDISTYTTQTLTFPANDNTNQCITFTVTDDLDVEGTETLEFTLQTTTNDAIISVPIAATVSISDNDIPQVLITEVADPDDNTNFRMVEICNRGTMTIDITGWALQGDFNGNTDRDFTVNVNGAVSLIGGACYVFANNNFPGDLSSCAGNTLSGSISSNGNEAFWLTDGTDDIDFYDGQTLGFENSVARRNIDITTPVTAFNTSEWTVEAADAADLTPCEDNFVLPVELASFTGKKTAQSVELNWTTVSEIDNSHFEVERSFNGKAFEQIGKVSGNGNSLEIKRYTFMDFQPKKGMNYYRLKQVDFDGKYEYSEIVAANLSSDKEISVTPTLASSHLNIQLIGNAHLVFMDVMGTKVKEATITDSQIVNISDLSFGTYFLLVEINGKTEVIRFVKQ